MGHHANMPFESSDDDLRKLREEGFFNQKKSPFGATGQYTDGKIANNDLGQIAIGITTLSGRVVLDFGSKPIASLGFTPDEAIAFASVLVKRAMECKKQ